MTALPIWLAPPRDEPAALPRPADASRRAGLIAFAAVVVGVGLLGRLCYLPYRFDCDGANFVYFGKYIAGGGRFGVDLIDNKFPTVGLMTSLAWRAFGPRWAAYVALQTVMSFAAAGLLAIIARRHFGRGTVLATFLAVVAYLNMAPVVYGGFQLETLQMFFEVLGAYAALRSLASDACRETDWASDRSRVRRERDAPAYAFAVGLCAGCAAMFKPTGLAVAAAFGVTAMWQHRRRPGRIVVLGLCGLAGTAVPAAITLAYLVASGTLAAMPGIWRELGRYAANSPIQWCDLNKAFTVPVLIAAPILVRGYIARHRRIPAQPDAVRFPRGRRSGHAAGNAGLLFAVAWLAFDLLGAASQGRLCAYHFLPLGAPLALLAGSFPRRDTAWLLAGALWPALALSLVGSISELRRASAEPARLAVSDYLVAHANRNNAVWADNAARLWLETDLQSGSRVPLTYLFLNTDDAPFRYGRMIVDDLEARRTRWVVLPARLHEKLARPHDYADDPIAQRRRNMLVAWGWIDASVRARYVPVATLDGQTVWERR